MSYYSQPPYNPASSPQNNLQFYPSSYGPNPVSGHTTPSQASYGNYGGSSYPSGSMGGGGGAASSAWAGAGNGAAASGVSGRMGEAGGLRTGWIAAFGTEGYEGEPPLMEELGVNPEHIRTKVGR